MLRVEGLLSGGLSKWLFHCLVCIFCLLVAALGLELDRRDLQLVQTFDKVAGDWRVALGSPAALDQRADVAVVLITEDSLLDYEVRSPVDRALLAQILRSIDQAAPRTIVLDIIFDRRTRSDDELLEAIAHAKAPVVLAAIDERVRDIDGTPPCESLLRQQDWLKAAARPVGHAMLERKAGRLPSGDDNIVRRLAEPLSHQIGNRLCRSVTPPGEPLADVAARAAGAKLKDGQRQIAWQRRPHDGSDLFDRLEIPRHDPFVAGSLAGKLKSAAWPDRIKGRVVLIGAQMIDRDVHETPLSVLEGPVPGVMIHAQAIAQRLDGNRDISVLPWSVSLAAIALLAYVTFWLARIVSFKLSGKGFLLRLYETVWAAGGFVLIGLAGLLALRIGSIELSSIALATVWIGAGWGGKMSSKVPVLGDADR
jgi:adenylate cyclase